jgi:uridine kinase
LDGHLSAILKVIPNLEPGNRFILALDGLSRSGKTTLSKKLYESLKEKKVPFYIFHIDDHIVERNKRYNTDHEDWYEYYGIQWDIDWLKEHLFSQLRETKNMSLSFYDNESDTHTLKDIHLPETCIIIIEGVFLQRKEWKDFYDYTVFLDCPKYKRYQRESDKSPEYINKLINRYWTAEEYYLKTETPLLKADLVLNG